ncbi:MAG TPA: response regulator [Pyrinomonadaceae bacterium]|nr:response regulator [Pyrinomonadaceae bacterium]
MTETAGKNLDRSVDASREQPVVLVTDDHDDTRLLFRTILAKRGCVVIEAADGEQAVRLAESAAPDLILMDSILPRMSGLDATRQIRELTNGRNTPIVFISGRAEPQYRAMALDAGCDEFLLKPLNFDLLGSVLEKHLGRLSASPTEQWI